MAAINFRRFCTPAQLYLILAGISLITAFFNDFQVITLVANGIFVLIWGWILNWLCSKGLKAISWVLVLLPFIFFIFTFFFTKDIISNATDEEGFQEGATDCITAYDGSKSCKQYATREEAAAAKKAANEKLAKDRDAEAAEIARKNSEASKKREIAAKEDARKAAEKK